MKNNRRLILLVSNHLSDRDYGRFGISILLRAGFKVEVWECLPTMSISARLRLERPYFEGVKRLTSLQQIFSEIDKISPCDAVLSDLSSTFHAKLILRNLTIKRKFWGIYRAGFGIFVNTKKDFLLNRIKDKIKRPFLIFEWLLHKLPESIFGVIPNYYFICGGKSALPEIEKLKKKPDLVLAHSLDYDLYLELKNSTIDDRYIVFIDEYLPFHPDWADIGIKPPIMPENYYPRLLKLFNIIEIDTGFKVKIASHPRSSYSKAEENEFFGSREVLKGKTLELVAKSEAVILSGSSAISFAVMSRKPILFITSKELDQRYLPRGHIRNLAKYFGREPLELDARNFNSSSLSMAKWTHYDKSYKDYSDRFIIVPGSKKINSWSILTQYLGNY